MACRHFGVDNLETPNYTYSEISGIKEIRLQVSTKNECSDEVIHNVEIMDLPIIGFEPTIATCGSSYTLTVTSSCVRFSLITSPSFRASSAVESKLERSKTSARENVSKSLTIFWARRVSWRATRHHSNPSSIKQNN